MTRREFFLGMGLLCAFVFVLDSIAVWQIVTAGHRYMTESILFGGSMLCMSLCSVTCAVAMYLENRSQFILEKLNQGDTVDVVTGKSV